MTVVKTGVKRKNIKADQLPDHLKEHVKKTNEQNKQSVKK